MKEGTVSRRLLLAGLPFVAALVAGAPAGAGLFDVFAAPRAELWERWLANDPGDSRTVDHGAWDRFLAAYVSPGADGIARVAYADVTAPDEAALDGYLDMLSGVAIGGYAPDEQRAFWINLYNALTVRVILSHYPVSGIREINISPGLFARGPWDRALTSVEGVALTLNDIEHRILRPIWRDPRVHYALNCASLGCPDLRRTAYTGAGVEAALEAAARAYVNHPRGVRFADGALIVSSIYRWFAADFGGGDAGVLDHLRRHAAPDLRARLAGIERIGDHAYDWALNDAARDPGARR